MQTKALVQLGELQAKAVELQKGGGYGDCDCDSFIPVNKWMILRETLSDRRHFVKQVGFKAAAIPDAV